MFTIPIFTVRDRRDRICKILEDGDLRVIQMIKKLGVERQILNNDLAKLGQEGKVQKVARGTWRSLKEDSSDETIQEFPT